MKPLPHMLAFAMLSLSSLAVGQAISKQTVTNTYAALTSPTVLVTDAVGGGTTWVTPPFPIRFYDRTYADVSIGYFGAILFPAGQVVTYLNATPGDPATPNAWVAPFWDELSLYSSNQGYIGTQTDGVAPHRTFTVEWNNISFFATSSITFSMMVRFFETGPVMLEVDYGSVSGTAGFTATAAMEDASGGNALTFAPSGCTSACGINDLTALSGQRIRVRYDDRAGVDKYGRACRRSIRFARDGTGDWRATAVADAFDPDFGTSIGVTGDDEVSTGQPLGFQFTFPGGAPVNAVSVDSNGRLLMPGNNTSDATPTVSEFLDDPRPTIAPFWTDWNLTAPTGGDILLRTGPGFATFTWDSIAQFNGTRPITVQVTLRDDDTFTVTYVGTAVFEEGIGIWGGSSVLVGVSPGSGVPDPGSSDLSRQAAGGAALYEFWDSASDDLDLQMTLEPLTAPAIGGPTWDLRVDGLPSSTLAAALLFGTTNPNLDLGLVPALGLGGCWLLTDGGLGTAGLSFSGNTSSVFSMPIAGTALGLIGFEVYVQAASISPGATPLGASLSNGVRGTLGL